MASIYVDFDNTLVNSIKTVVDIYNDEFRGTKRFKPVDWTTVNSYSFKELKRIFPNWIKNTFESEDFFQRCKLDYNAKEVLKTLKQEFEIYVCTLGTGKNLKLKKQYVQKELPFIEGFIGLNTIDNSDKSSVDMSNGFLIDDLDTNLQSSNAKFKICFGDKYSWNSDFQINIYQNRFRCANWWDVQRVVLEAWEFGKTG